MSYKKFLLCAPFAVALLATSCKKEDQEGMDEMKDKAKVIFIHASPRATGNTNLGLFTYYNDRVYNPNALTWPSFNNYKAVDPGALTMRFDSVTTLPSQPPGTQATLKTATVNVAADSYYSMFSTGTYTAARFDTLFLRDDLTPPSRGKAKVRFINIVTDSVRVDIVNAATGTAFPNATGLTYKGRTDFFEIDPGDFTNVRIRENGTSNYISASGKRIMIEAGSIYTIWTTGFKTPPAGAPGAEIRYLANRYNLVY